MIVSQERGAHRNWQLKGRNVGKSGGEHGDAGLSPGVRTPIIAVDSFVSVQRVAVTATSITGTATVLSGLAHQEDLRVESRDLK